MGDESNLLRSPAAHQEVGSVKLRGPEYEDFEVGVLFNLEA